ncbi:hypothetical protein B0H34DRAFT_684939 [Crassisporium funariophilum]|nr:hypothetical protein B0H34DRAFT_684939 [Crassisporium funariophilum]
MKVDCDMLQILLEYEEDLSCPICYDILVAAHVGNPCGHSFCGDCGWKWHVENKNKECPVCRTTLEKSGPLIPNIKMDRTVETHLKTLALAGDQDWEPGGRKMKEWDIRKEAWKKGAADRARKKASGPRRARTFVPSVQVFDIETIHEALGNGRWVQVGDNVDEDPTYEDSDVELIPRPIRRVRRRRRDE